jgi:hypothetical protein
MRGPFATFAGMQNNCFVHHMAASVRFTNVQACTCDLGYSSSVANRLLLEHMLDLFLHRVHPRDLLWHIPVICHVMSKVMVCLPRLDVWQEPAHVPAHFMQFHAVRCTTGNTPCDGSLCNGLQLPPDLLAEVFFGGTLGHVLSQVAVYCAALWAVV